MAKLKRIKQERILVLSTKNPCQCVLQEGCHVNDSCGICNVGMTIDDAIEKMARAIYDEEIGRCNSDMCVGKSCKDCFRWKKCVAVAKATLNALMER